METGTREAELFAERLLDLEPLVAERRQRAGGAGELPDQHTRFQFLQPFGVAIEHCQPDRGLVAERHRQRLLQMGATGHWRIAVALRQIGQDTAQVSDIVFNDLKARAQLQHHRCIHDILGGRAPVQIAACLAALPGDLMHQRQDRIADSVGLTAQQIEIQRRHIGPFRDLLRSVPRNHAAARLGFCQRDLDLGIAGNQAEVRKHLAHRRSAESIAEQDEVEDSGRSRENGHGRAF